MEEEKEKARDKQIFTIICCSFFVLVAVPLFIVSITTKYPRAIPVDAFKPLYVPTAMLFFIITVCTALLIGNIRKLVKTRSVRIKAGESIKKFILATPNSVIAMGATILYGIAWKFLGFTLSTIIFVALLSKRLEPERSWKQVILVSIGLGLFIFFLFVIVFKVPFPDRIMGPVMNFILYR